MTYLEFSIALSLGFILWAALDFNAVLDLGYKLDAYISLAVGYLALAPSYLRMRIVSQLMLYKMRREFKMYTKPNRKPH
jgi:hypothetical protein